MPSVPSSSHPFCALPNDIDIAINTQFEGETLQSVN